MREALAAAAQRGFDLAERAAAAGASVCARGRGARAVAAAAPHCGRRLVVGAAVRAILRAPMRRAAGGRAPELAGAAGAICRLHAVAARGAGRGERSAERDCAPACVLDRDAQGAARPDRAADRPAAAGGREPSRRPRARCSIGAELARRAAGACAREPGEPVHGAAGGACGAADPAGGGHRHRRSAARLRAAPTARSTIWSAFSSTRWCCAPTRRAIRASAT